MLNNTKVCMVKHVLILQMIIKNCPIPKTITPCWIFLCQAMRGCVYWSFYSAEWTELCNSSGDRNTSPTPVLSRIHDAPHQQSVLWPCGADNHPTQNLEPTPLARISPAGLGSRQRARTLNPARKHFSSGQPRRPVLAKRAAFPVGCICFCERHQHEVRGESGWWPRIKTQLYYIRRSPRTHPSHELYRVPSIYLFPYARMLDITCQQKKAMAINVTSQGDTHQTVERCWHWNRRRESSANALMG